MNLCSPYSWHPTSHRSGTGAIRFCRYVAVVKLTEPYKSSSICPLQRQTISCFDAGQPYLPKKNAADCGSWTWQARWWSAKSVFFSARDAKIGTGNVLMEIITDYLYSRHYNLIKLESSLVSLIPSSSQLRAGGNDRIAWYSWKFEGQWRTGIDVPRI